MKKRNCGPKSEAWKAKVSAIAKRKAEARILGLRKFGRLTPLLIEKVGDLLVAICFCDCATTHTVPIKDLESGNTQSCGCLRDEIQNARKTTHGMTGSREYSIWTNMRTRCYNPNNEAYPDYGGRGITICDEWRVSFSKFYADMGPSNGLTIQRIDNDKGYSKDNCKWADYVEQASNRRPPRKAIA